MSVKREQHSERSRRSDKMIVETHREFLDMDTDEEDFGRQESTEVEEDVPSEPEKPVFNEQDLITLVEYVKSLVVLPSLQDSHWNDDCHEIIREYFKNPSHIILSIFYDENKLAASLSLPDYAPNGFTYFSRLPWQVYTTDNFFNTILFGTVNKDVESSILKCMENIYAPVALNNDDPSELIKNDLYLNLHEFLMCLMEKFYHPKGLTVLYFPREHLINTFLEPSSKIDCFLLGEDNNTILAEQDERKQKLVGRLETIVWHWIKEIRRATKATTIRKNIKCIRDEVNYWKALHFNLNYLRDQLSNSDVRLIINILTNFRSPSVEFILDLTKQVQRGLEEASSNLMYLNILSQSCKDLKIPDEIDESITHALLLILFIWAESPFYNTTDNMKTLCGALSSQIIHQCNKYIKLDVALGSNPESGIKMLEKCILCCETYKTIYETLITRVVPQINPDKKWDINTVEIFNNIDTFKRRCFDAIDVCKALIVFGRCNKVGLLGSPKGTEYEAYCRKIENLFYESLDQIITASEILFDVTKSGWHKIISQFRNTVVQLENMVKNLINDVFENVKNTEEGIQAIYAFQKFKQRECLKEILEKKWTQVWKIFSNEIKVCYTTAINEIERYDQSTDWNVVHANVTCIVQNLEAQYTVIINALDWIGDCPAKKCVLEQFKRVLGAIDKRRKLLESPSA